jgi:flagellar biosynthesis protein FlhG
MDDGAAGRYDQAERLRAVAERQLSEQQRSPADRYCRVLAVTGGKGGVGKTNVAVNLSLALCEAGARVLLLDADLGLANVDVVLGLSASHTLEHVVHREAALSDVVATGPLGLRILPGGTGVPDLADLNTLEIVRLLGSLRALEREQDFMVIDTAAGVNQSVTRFALAASDVVIVTTPEPPAMLDAYGVMKVLKANRLMGQLHLLVNMVRQQGEALVTHRSLSTVASRYLGLTLGLLGALPLDETVSHCVRERKPFFLAQPQCQAARRMRRIAGFLLAGRDAPGVRRDASYFAHLLDTAK